MDVKEYIASGVVELYAMNALPSGEKKEFERNLLLYPELGDELRNVSQALERYADDHAVNPRPQLRLRLVENGHANSNAENANRFSATSRDRETTNDKQQTTSNKHSLLTYKYLIAASLAALVISTFASWFFYSRWVDEADRFSNLLSDKNELAESYNLVKFTYDENLTKLFVMRDPSTRMFELRSADTSTHYLARVYWNPVNHRTYVDMLSLPDAGEGKQYQLWAINADARIDAGICAIDESGLQQMRDVDMASGWILSIEQKGMQVTTPSGGFLVSK
jgi:anti-sigma-K factor RskA